MIENISVNWKAWIDGLRETYQDEWISSVKLSMEGVDVYKLRKLCNKHPKFHALCINISGCIKYWYQREFINQMISQSKKEKP